MGEWCEHGPDVLCAMAVDPPEIQMGDERVEYQQPDAPVDQLAGEVVDIVRQ